VDFVENIKNLMERLKKLDFREMYNNDFFLTWEKSNEELESVFVVADILRSMREINYSRRFLNIE